MAAENIQLGHISTDFDFNGALAKASPNRALFALYLAMHERPADRLLALEDVQQAEFTDDTFPERLNTYRRAPFSADESTLDNARCYNEFLHNSDQGNANLWMCMHPDSLALMNDASYISPDVIANCNIYTQMDFLATSQAKAVDVDPTLLADTIPESVDFRV